MGKSGKACTVSIDAFDAGGGPTDIVGEHGEMVSDNRQFAHSLPEPFAKADWETLAVHQGCVAVWAEQFAAAFGAGAWGRLAGLWHDLGKVQPEFQSYIRGLTTDGPPHAWVGAVLAATVAPKLLVPIAFAIAGHHAGLADLKRDEAADAARGPTPLLELVQQYKGDLARLRPLLPADAFATTPPDLPAHVVAPGAAATPRLAMFVRFLFSALVDADRLATAGFYARFVPSLTADDLRYDDIATLSDRLDRAIDAMPPKGSPAVVSLRRQVLVACRDRAGDAPGRFSLTVPTGGGKTLSAMSFALRHALRHGLRRVIVVIPYTSIIEQSARVYRDVLNDAGAPDVNNVVEHHSNLDEQALTESDARGEQLRKLAAENWDAPVVVTTTVQFFESLLSNQPSRCRKLHNIARSVVLLDEVQTLPPQFLRTILDVLNQLTDHYGASVVLATATPPALAKRAGAARPGLDAREIMPDPARLAAHARRACVEWRIAAPVPYEDLARELCGQRRALVIVHRRDDARRLAELIGDEALHLSAAMCPAHRLVVIDDVRRRLAAGGRCLLVSTQLIEAGVDVDFPVVYRALAGLDSIAQSAGRCDREGKLTDAACGAPAGRMVVFRAETDPPPGVPRKALDSMTVLLGLGAADPFDPRDSVRYFDELYGKVDDDQHRIEPLRRGLMFASVAERFRIIDGDTHPVVVPWDDGLARLAAFQAGPSRQTRRALQPFTVQVRQYVRDQLREAGVISPGDEFGQFDVVNEGRQAAYHARYGLVQRKGSVAAPEELML